MQIDRNPVHRRIINPWYDSNLACWIMMLVLLPFFLFGLAGMQVVHSDEAYRRFAWVPVGLTALSALLIVMNLGRLLYRWLVRLAR